MKKKRSPNRVRMLTQTFALLGHAAQVEFRGERPAGYSNVDGALAILALLACEDKTYITPEVTGVPVYDSFLYRLNKYNNAKDMPVLFGTLTLKKLTEFYTKVGKLQAIIH